MKMHAHQYKFHVGHKNTFMQRKHYSSFFVVYDADDYFKPPHVELIDSPNKIGSYVAVLYTSLLVTEFAVSTLSSASNLISHSHSATALVVTVSLSKHYNKTVPRAVVSTASQVSTCEHSTTESQINVI